MATLKGIRRLPPEVLDIITSHLDERDDLRNLRISCRILNAAAEALLFRTVHLTPEDSSVKNFIRIGDSERLGQHVRTIVIETLPDIDFTINRQNSGWRSFDYDKYRVPYNLLSSLPRLVLQFPYADEVNVKFSADNNGHESESGAVQPFSARQTHLSVLFDVIRRRNEARMDPMDDSPEMRPITKFTNTSLLKFSPEGLEKTLDPVLGSMTEFHFSVRVMRLAWAVQFEPLKLSQDVLCERWLEPMASKLTSLSMYMDTYWGAIPNMDLSGLRLPRLTTLRLGNYCFAYPGQIEWISSLISLQLLSLDDCPIVALIDHDEYLIKPKEIVESGIWEERIYDDKRKTFYINKAKWSGYFHIIGTRLLNLKHFRCGHGNWDTKSSESKEPSYGIESFRTAFESRADLGSAIHSTRYVVFAGRASTFWRPAWFEVHIDHPVGNEMPKKAQNRLLQKIHDPTKIPELSHDDRLKDQESLERLLDILRRRRMLPA